MGQTVSFRGLDRVTYVVCVDGIYRGGRRAGQRQQEASRGTAVEWCCTTRETIASGTTASRSIAMG